MLIPPAGGGRKNIMSVKKLFDLGGKAALVTGGSRGLGVQMAEALGEMGAKGAPTARKPQELDEAVAPPKPMGSKAGANPLAMSNAPAAPPPVARAIAR